MKIYITTFFLNNENMIQINERITVLNPGDQLPAVTNDAVKVYLGGTMDFSSSVNDWQQIWIDGLTKLSDPISGLLLIKNVNWIIFNPHVPPQQPLAPTLDNPEFVQTMQWRMQMQDIADLVFINIMNKSVSPIPVLEFGSLVTSGKLVLRCGEQHQIYSQIRMYCEKYNVPLLTGKTSVKDVILAAGNYIQKFRDLQQMQIPE